MIVCPLHWYFSPSHLDDVQAEMLVTIAWWRARDRLVSARVAAEKRGLSFADVVIDYGSSLKSGSSSDGSSTAADSPRTAASTRACALDWNLRRASPPE